MTLLFFFVFLLNVGSYGIMSSLKWAVGSSHKWVCKISFFFFFFKSLPKFCSCMHDQQVSRVCNSYRLFHFNCTNEFSYWKRKRVLLVQRPTSNMGFKSHHLTWKLSFESKWTSQPGRSFCTVAASKLHRAAWRIFGPTGSMTLKRSILNAWGHETLLCAQNQSQEHPLSVCSDWTPHYKVKTKTRKSNVSKNTGMPWLSDSTLLTYSFVEVTKNHSLWWVQSEAELNMNIHS